MSYLICLFICAWHGFFCVARAWCTYIPVRAWCTYTFERMRRNHQIMYACIMQ